MILTPVLFLCLWGGGIIATLAVGAQFGVYTYLMAFHMSPHHTWWDKYVPDLRYVMIAGLMAALGAVGRKDPYLQEQWYRQRGFFLLILFNLYLWIELAWARSPLHLDGCILFLKHLIIAAVIYKVAKERKEFFKNILLWLVIGSAWFGYLTMGKGGRVEGVAGAIASANLMGMHTASALLIASMMVLGFKDRYRWIPFFCAPLILNTVIQSGSRGAFLGVMSGGLVAYLFIPKRLAGRFMLLGVGAVVLFFMLAHEQFIERIVELYNAVESEDEQLDNSASSRIVIAKAQWQMVLDYPLGYGHRGTALLSPLYMDEKWLTKGTGVGAQAARSSHNSYLAALVSYGFVGFAIFCGLFFWAGAVLLRLKRQVSTPEHEEYAILVAAIATGLTVPAVCGNFTNFVAAENQYWLFALTAALSAMIARDVPVTSPGRYRARQQAGPQPRAGLNSGNSPP